MQVDLSKYVRPDTSSVWAYDSSFPVSVLIDDQLAYEEARIMIVDDPNAGAHLLVWVVRNGIECVVDSPVQAMDSTVGLRKLLLTDGRTITVHPTSGCGCGNPLKSWSPAREAGVTVSRVGSEPAPRIVTG